MLRGRHARMHLEKSGPLPRNVKAETLLTHHHHLFARDKHKERRGLQASIIAMLCFTALVASRTAARAHFGMRVAGT